MIEMEQDILDRACAHYIKKRNLRAGITIEIEDRKIIVEDFWKDYFAGNPIYNWPEWKPYYD